MCSCDLSAISMASIHDSVNDVSGTSRYFYVSQPSASDDLGGVQDKLAFGVIR